jgi:peptidoglycan/xylan/chitin deacetylase (PgdA/CDA1 family)
MKAILTYHSIDKSGSPISISPDAFARHHTWLAGGRVRVLPLDDLIARCDEADDAVAVTFDDGFLNVRDPIECLLADGVPATVFVVSGRVGTSNAWGGREQSGIPTLPLMDWHDLTRLAERGAVLASHTRNHPMLTRLSPDAQDEELAGCRQDLEARLGVRTDHVCYPYGDVDAGVAARSAVHYRYGYATSFRVLRGQDPAMLLPRLDTYYFRAPGALEAWGSGAFRRRVLWCQLRRHVRTQLVGCRRDGGRRVAS